MLITGHEGGDLPLENHDIPTINRRILTTKFHSKSSQLKQKQNQIYTCIYIFLCHSGAAMLLRSSIHEYSFLSGSVVAGT